jgi:hypothetical protein
VAFQESLDSVTDGGKITDLNPFSDGSTDAIQTDQAFKQWSYVVRAPLGHHYTSYNGNFWPQGTDAGNGKLGVPANAHTHYIFFAQSMKGEFLNNYSTMNRVPIMAVWRTDDINDLVSSPSSALELFTDINQAYSGGSALDEYVKDEWVVGRTSHMQNRQQLSYTENGQVYLNYNDRYGAHFDFIIDGPGTPQFNTDTTPFRRYTLTSDVERRGSVVNAPDPANDIKHHKVWFIEDVGAGAKGVATDQFPYYDFYWRNMTTWKGSNNTSANYGINLLLNKPDDINRVVEQNNKLQMIKIQDSIIALYGDVTGATDQMGVPYIYGMTGNPNPLTGQTYNTNGASDKTLVEDRMEWYNTTSNFKTQDTGISDIAVTVSDTNSSDSSNTAYEPDSIKMAQLAGDYFAVVWRKSTTAYISVFEVNHQTSDQPTFTRHADSVNLGTVPEGNISITPMGDGVAVLTCGNYYRIIKTDAI